MNTEDNIADKLALERLHSLQEKRQQLMDLDPREIMERILDDPQPVALVHSFPEQDFYFLIHDLGPEDAGPLLSLASNRQWDHIVDLASWQRDRMDIRAISRWLDLLLEADPQRFINWMLKEKLEFVEFYLSKNIEVRVREHDQDPSEFGKEFFTLDNTYYIRFIDAPADSGENPPDDDPRQKFLTRLIENLAEHDHRIFQGILLEATHLIPAETEEDCYRWRNVRLAEKGFLPFDDAVGIYQPIKPQDLAAQRAKFIPPVEDPSSLLPVSQYPLRMLTEDNEFTRALAAIEPGNVLNHIQFEFANLCNQIIVADHKTIREREQLRDVVKKACGYINIGLRRLSKASQKDDPHRAAVMITKHQLAQIFRVGFGEALKLKWQVEKWLDQCWFARRGLRLTFWGEQWLGVLGGLLIKKPLFYDNYQTGVLYREYATLEDIQTTADIFGQIKALDNLLSLMTLDIERPASHGLLTYKNLILTLWARSYLNLAAPKLKPLTLEQFKPFFEQLLPGPPDPAGDSPRHIPQVMKNHFINWLAADTGLKDFELTGQLGKTLDQIFAEVESELGRVAAADLDPRYVQLFWLAPKKS
jgi:hypothetical protein